MFLNSSASADSAGFPRLRRCYSATCSSTPRSSRLEAERNRAVAASVWNRGTRPKEVLGSWGRRVLDVSCCKELMAACCLVFLGISFHFVACPGWLLGVDDHGSTTRSPDAQSRPTSDGGNRHVSSEPWENGGLCCACRKTCTQHRPPRPKLRLRLLAMRARRPLPKCGPNDFVLQLELGEENGRCNTKNQGKACQVDARSYEYRPSQWQHLRTGSDSRLIMAKGSPHACVVHTSGITWHVLQDARRAYRRSDAPSARTRASASALTSVYSAREAPAPNTWAL